jgi:hypothetical protein
MINALLSTQGPVELVNEQIEGDGADSDLGSHLVGRVSISGFPDLFQEVTRAPRCPPSRPETCLQVFPQ